jgi:hypothetical protein
MFIRSYGTALPAGVHLECRIGTPITNAIKGSVQLGFCVLVSLYNTDLFMFMLDRGECVKWIIDILSDIGLSDY